MPSPRGSARLASEKRYVNALWERDPVAAWARLASRRARASARAKGFQSDVNQAAIRQWYSQQNGRCFYCGTQLEIARGRYKNGEQMDRISVDRIDSSKHYSRANCVLACLKCNFRKSDNTPESLRMLLRGIERAELLGANRARVEVGREGASEDVSSETPGKQEEQLGSEADGTPGVAPAQGV